MIPKRGPKINRFAVQAIRVSQGLSQVALARRAQLDNSYVCRLESGQRSRPAPIITRRLADALGVPVAAIIINPDSVSA
ncbi:helix-turn-helix domain-containing protein [Nonomuraea sp. NPDC050663]|uniref:helix-turn-helix domain-containing protein n=1 Tax=Nonomuraea sp. NPDC050663 TaxID=3364370 RepID=UPI00379F1228